MSAAISGSLVSPNHGKIEVYPLADGALPTDRPVVIVCLRHDNTGLTTWQFQWNKETIHAYHAPQFVDKTFALNNGYVSRENLFYPLSEDNAVEAIVAATFSLPQFVGRAVAPAPPPQPPSRCKCTIM